VTLHHLDQLGFGSGSLFPRIINTWFDDIEVIQIAVTTTLNEVSIEIIQSAYCFWENRWKNMYIHKGITSKISTFVTISRINYFYANTCITL